VSDKPVYAIPTMHEIAQIPWNGYNVASLFSGCGGSSLGYKFAGFHVLYANEFIPAAQETYRANHLDTYLDTRDIRQVTGDDVLRALHMHAGDLDVLDGSPPCASFSSAGVLENGWGRVKPYSDTKQRVDDLFDEYARLLRELQPRVFIAENVSGLVRGVAKGYFKEIYRTLIACGYRVEARVLDAQWLGVPQMRKRLIFQGVRSDLAVATRLPDPLPYRYTIRDVLPNIVGVKRGGYADNWGTSDQSSPTITQSDALRSETAYLSGGGWVRVAKSDTDLGAYAVGKEWDKLAPGQQSTKYFSLKRAPIDAPSQTITQRGGNASAASVTHPTERRKFTIDELRVICSFPSDFVLTGTYAQQWERLGRAVPPLMMMRVAHCVRALLDECSERTHDDDVLTGT
jgi:DNA (cytosine-5)-methyltransferase 1